MASQPRAKSGNRTVAECLNGGRGTTLNQASVMTPSVPSLPSIQRSGLGPAPLAGNRRDSHTPTGQTARTDSTRSSMCVGPAA